MSRFTKGSIIFIMLLAVLLVFASCSSGTGGDGDENVSGGGNANPENNQSSKNDDDNKANNNEGDVEREPVTIKISIPLGEEYFNARFGPAAAKLDHINIEQVGHGGSVEALEEMFANNQHPDIIISNYAPIEELGLGYPLDDLIEKYGFDLDRLDQSLLSFMRALDGEGRVAGFPDGNSFFGLYYNKNVFDVLGKNYPDPEVPMTWTEVLELSKEMTREVNGVQYYGLQGGYGVALTQQGAPRTDPETGEVLIEKDPAFKRYLEFVESLFSIPGMETLEGTNPFVEEQTAAMIIASNNYFNWGWGSPEPSEIEHIDIAPVPVWEDLPNTRPASNAWPMVIANYSEHKEEAFELLMAYLDDDVQIEMAKTMMLQTPLSDPEVLKYYATEVPQYEGKNIQAYFHGDPAEHVETQSQWDQYVNIGEAERRIREEGLDVNTALRELAEEARGLIEAAKSSQ